MITWNELKYIVRTVLHWWWIVALSVVLSVTVAFFLSRSETRYYVARSTLMIGNTLESTLPDPNQIQLGSSLARFYGELARREPILQPVEERLQLPFPWQYVSDRMLMTNVLPTANLLEIYITDTNPDRAAAIANAIGDQLTAYSPTSPDKIAVEQEALERQLRESDQKIQEIQDELNQLSGQQEQATSASDLAELNQKIASLNALLEQEQATYRSLLVLKNNSVVNSISFFERAKPPSSPLPSKRLVALGIASMAGMLLGLAGVYVIDRFDPRWRGGADVEDRFHMPNLGAVPLGPPIIISEGAFAHEREQAVRNAHTNILLAAAERGARTLLISSPKPSGERASFSIDLAHLFARSGQQVLLVDADLSSPLVTQLLLGQGEGAHTGDHNDHDPESLWRHLRTTVIPNVVLLPGRLHNGDALPTLVPSLRWSELVQQLMDAADVIIFDGPTALSSADAALLAPHVDGAVLVLEPASDDREEVARSKARLLHQQSARLLGAVTMTPSKQGRGMTEIWKRLRGTPLPALPAGSERRQAAEARANEVDTEGPQAATPLVTPPPVEWSGEQAPESQAVAPSTPSQSNGRRRRRARGGGRTQRPQQSRRTS